MLKKLVRKSLARLGYQLVRAETLARGRTAEAERDALAAACNDLRRDLAAATEATDAVRRGVADVRPTRAELERDLAGYKAAFEQLQQLVGEYRKKYEHLPPDLAGYKNALELALRDLAACRAALAAPGGPELRAAA